MSILKLSFIVWIKLVGMQGAVVVYLAMGTGNMPLYHVMTCSKDIPAMVGMPHFLYSQIYKIDDQVDFFWNNFVNLSNCIHYYSLSKYVTVRPVGLSVLSGFIWVCVSFWFSTGLDWSSGKFTLRRTEFSDHFLLIIQSLRQYWMTSNCKSVFHLVMFIICILSRHASTHLHTSRYNSIQFYSCSIISTTGKVTSQIKSYTSHRAVVIKYKQISMKLDTHYIYTLQEDIYIYINSNHQNITSIKYTLHRPKHKPKHGNLLL
jgi:hypothetical protein